MLGGRRERKGIGVRDGCDSRLLRGGLFSVRTCVQSFTYRYRSRCNCSNDLGTEPINLLPPRLLFKGTCVNDIMIIARLRVVTEINMALSSTSTVSCVRGRFVIISLVPCVSLLQQP